VNLVIAQGQQAFWLQEERIAQEVPEAE